jgi:plasmid stabilization system protein ParE
VRVRLGTEARSDLTEAIVYYRATSKRLARCFRDAIREALRVIGGPVRFRPVHGEPGCFAYRLPDWPFTVFYEVHDGQIVVIAIAFQRRDPEHWKRRRNQ